MINSKAHCKKAVVFLANDDKTGASRMAFNYLKWLQVNGFQTLLICPPRSEWCNNSIISEISESGTSVIELQGLLKSVSISNLIELCLLLWKEKPLLCLTCHTRDIKLAAVATFILGVKYIISVQIEIKFYGTKHQQKLKRFFYKRFISLPNVFLIATSSKIFNDLIANYNVSASKVELISNCADFTNSCGTNVGFKGRDELAQFKKSCNASFAIVSVGKIHEQKGYIPTLAVMAKVLNHKPNVIWVIIGDVVGNDPDDLAYKKMLIEEISRNKLTDKVILYGWCDYVNSVLQGADVFLLNSLWEGFPLVLLEAMSAGCPAIFSDCFGEIPLFKNWIHGVQVSSDDELSCSLVKILSMGSQERQMLGENGRVYAKDQFDKNIISKKFIRYVKKIGGESE